MELADTATRWTNTTSLQKIIISGKTIVTNSPNGKSSRQSNIFILQITGPTKNMSILKLMRVCILKR